MQTVSKSQTVTLRLPQDLYRQTSDLARRRNQSVNAVLQESIQRLLKEEENRALSDAFDLLSQYPEECNIDYATSAQAEVMLNDEL